MRKLFLFLFFVLSAWTCYAAIDYSAIDSFAENAPPLRTTTGLPKLVQYLTKPYKTDAEKARVLLAWIVYNINYDNTKPTKADIAIILDVEENAKTGELTLKHGDLKILHEEDTIQRTLQTRKGICKDIAHLYQHMCQLAGLEVETIGGYACDKTPDLHTSEAHVWNAIKIDGSWYFIDPTWALQGRIVYVNDARDAKRIQRQLQHAKNIDQIKGVRKAVNNDWFLLNKEQIIQTHFPFERRWQLQKRRVSFEDFLKRSCRTTLRQFLTQN